MIFNGLIQKGMSVIRRFLPYPCIHCLRSIFRFKNVSTNDCVDASQADLPYFATLKEFEEAGKILKRENIYGSGPPSPTFSTRIEIRFFYRSGCEKVSSFQGVRVSKWL